MTLRVSRDSGRSWGPVTEVREAGNPVILPDSTGCPACTCPRCTLLSPPAAASPGTES
ncbi:hypothetical protein ACFWNK_11135 [Streptomyces sp. NPDC058417]|uniref:hypothetical protein n=1 Tax=unclassified Streptomyces TaxID=2593676 RepID=UPI0036640A4F